MITVRIVPNSVLTHIIYLHGAHIAHLPGGGLEMVERCGESLLLVQLDSPMNILTLQEPSSISCNYKYCV